MEQWVVLTRGGGSEERPDEFRARGPFPSFEAAEHWLEQKYGPLDEMQEATRNYLEPQMVLLEDPNED